MSEKRQMRIKLLHISSAGRSGSTLLGMALNARPGFFYGGEIYSVWNDNLAEALCSCGEGLADCLVWGSAIRGALNESGLGDIESLRALRDSTVRLTRLATRRFLPLARERANTYRRTMESLYRTLSGATGSRVIVDTSQYIGHSLLMSEAPGFDPYIVHLVRDPRAVVFSWSRARTWPTKTGGVVLKKGMSAAIRQWAAHNLKLMAILRRSRIPHLMLRYEDFARDPDAVARRIMRLIGEDPEPSLTNGTNTVVIDNAHAIQANPVRFHHGPMPISPDEQWRAQMPPRDRLITTLLTYPLLARFDYDARR